MLSLIPIFVLVIGFMWWMTRKQRTEQAKVTSMQSALQVGDHVITVSGLYGTIVDADDTTIDLEIAEDVVTTWLRGAIREVRVDTAESVESDAESTDDLPSGQPGIESIDPDKD